MHLTRSIGKSAAITPRLVSPLAWLTLGGIALYVILDVVAQALPPHYSPIRQPESDLAVGPYGWVMTINFVVRGLLSVCILAALALILPASRRRSIGLTLLGIWAVGALLLAAFPTDVGRGERTVHGAVHLAVALLAFVSTPIAAKMLTRSLVETPRWSALGARLKPFANLVVGGFVVLVAGALFPRVGGLTERVFLASALLWMLILALGLRHVGSRSGQHRNREHGRASDRDRGTGK